MQRLVRRYHLKTVLGAGAPPDHPLAVREGRRWREEMGVRWVHIQSSTSGAPKTTGSSISISKRPPPCLRTPNNYPVYFHCHHGITGVDGSDLPTAPSSAVGPSEQATEEVASVFRTRDRSPRARLSHMESFYIERVLPFRTSAPPVHASARGGNGVKTAP